jgi:hypothetical protein
MAKPRECVNLPLGRWCPDQRRLGFRRIGSNGERGWMMTLIRVGRSQLLAPEVQSNKKAESGMSALHGLDTNKWSVRPEQLQTVANRSGRGARQLAQAGADLLPPCPTHHTPRSQRYCTAVASVPACAPHQSRVLCCAGGGAWVWAARWRWIHMFPPLPSDKTAGEGGPAKAKRRPSSAAPQGRAHTCERRARRARHGWW